MSPGAHDMGGDPAGPVDRSEPERTLFEQRVDAMQRLLCAPDRALFTVDALRRAIESLPADTYRRLGYYERWLRAMAVLLVERGVIGEDELRARVAAQATGGPTPRARDPVGAPPSERDR